MSIFGAAVAPRRQTVHVPGVLSILNHERAAGITLASVDALTPSADHAVCVDVAWIILLTSSHADERNLHLSESLANRAALACRSPAGDPGGVGLDGDGGVSGWQADGLDVVGEGDW